MEKEIDDFIVNRRNQRRGIGQQLLLLGINHIRKENNNPIFLHVANKNVTVVELYMYNGFIIT